MLSGSGTRTATIIVGYSDVGFEQALQVALQQAEEGQESGTTLYWDVTYHLITEKASPGSVLYVVFVQPPVADLGW